MATKAIYTMIDGKYYKVNQDTTTPNEVVRVHRTHSQMNTEPSSRVVNSNIWINALDTDADIYSNKELVNSMIDYLLANKVVKIPDIQNHFVMYCDYSVFNSEGKEINHNAFTKPIKPKDAIYNLGVDRESELVYKQVKTFNTDIALIVKNDYPMGIMRNSSSIRYSIQINDLSIYQDLVYTDDDAHNSSDTNSYPISKVLETMVKIYSTHDNGIAIAAVEVPFIPKKIVLDVSVTLDNTIVVYDQKDIDNIIHDNIIDEETDGGNGSIEPGQIVILNGGSAIE